MEVLSPAGSKDALRAALRGGADAVYLGGKMFGARRFAQNFSDGELRAAVRTCHQHGMKVYATVNTLIKEDELSIAASHIDMLSSIDMDAVIVQDRGLLRMIKERTDMRVHASTQMGVHSPEDAQWAENNGMDRAILSRELTLDEVKTNQMRHSYRTGGLCTWGPMLLFFWSMSLLITVGRKIRE